MIQMDDIKAKQILADLVNSAIKTGLVYGTLVRMSITENEFDEALNALGVLDYVSKKRR
jgi:hypothetical protein